MLEILLGWISPGVWLKKVYDWLMRPSLEIYYDPEQTYLEAIDRSFHDTVGLFVHVMIRNNGKTPARNCIGELRRIEVFSSGKFNDVREYRNIMQLKWAHEDTYAPKDIDPGDSKRLDVCYVHQGIDVLHFFTKKYPSGNQTDFLPGTYKITIRIKSENTKNIDGTFVVKYNAGNFRSLKINTYSHNL